MKRQVVISLMLLVSCFILLCGCAQTIKDEDIAFKSEEVSDWQVVVRNQFGTEKFHYYNFEDIDDRESPVEINLRYSGAIHNLDIVVMYKGQVAKNYVAILDMRKYFEDKNADWNDGTDMTYYSVPIQNEGYYYLEGDVTDINEIDEAATGYGVACRFCINVYVENWR